MARTLVKDLSKILNISISLTEFRITNLVASASLGYRLDLGHLAEDQIAQKDDSFPGAIHYMKNPVKSALLFSSGKVVLTGAKKFAHIEEAFLKLQ